MSVRCDGSHYDRSQGPEKDPRIFDLLVVLVFAALAIDLRTQTQPIKSVFQGQKKGDYFNSIKLSMVAAEV